MVAQAQSKSQAKPRRELQPLGGLGLLFYPVLTWFVRGGSARAKLDARKQLAIDRAENRRTILRMQRDLRQEARFYRKIIVERWSAIGFNWRYRWNDGNPDDEKPRKRRRTDKVRIELERYNEHAIYFKINVREKKLFGFRTVLPYKVLVSDLIGETSLAELTYACQHKVTARYDDPRKGAWIIVHRTEDIGMLPKLVRYRHMLPHYPEDMSRASMILGVGENNTVHEVNLEDYPHILVAGASRSGKSNMLNNMLSALIRFCRAGDLKLILIDPKKVELSYYRNVPHLERPIIYDYEEAVGVLEEMNALVDERTDKLMGKAKELSTYNKRYPGDAMPRIVVVVEELASLYPTKKQGEEVKRLITRIANMGRAVGVHLILCTQLPIVEIIPSVIKVNMWIRIAGRVQNATESMVILGTGDAARLPAVPGRMVYGRDSYKHFIQTPLIDEDDIKEAIAIAKGRELGLIDLCGHEPRIIPDRLLLHIINSTLQGKLSPYQLAMYFRPVGITAAMLKPFLEDVVKAGWIRLGEEVYQVRKLHKLYHLQLVQEGEADPDAIDVDDGLPTTRRVPILRRLGAPAPLLMLPAPAQPVEVAPEPEPEPLPPLQVPEQIPVAEGDLLQAFLLACCTMDKHAWLASKELYIAYCTWCLKHDYTPLARKPFGQALMDLGFQAIRKSSGGNQSRGWTGLKLNADVIDMISTTDMVDVS
jgi:hypothetical protein